MGERGYGPWVKHDGSGCPVIEQWVIVERSDFSQREVVAGSECIAHGVSPNDRPSAWVWTADCPIGIMRYRVAKPRDLSSLLMVDELEDA